MTAVRGRRRAAAARGLRAGTGERARARLRNDPTTTLRALDAPSTSITGLDSFDGGSIYVVEQGDGPPIVLSHGVTNSIRDVVLPARVAAAGRVPHDRVRPPRSRRVEGRRPRVTRSRPWRDDMRSVVEGLDLRDAVLVGHSMGGVAVQAFVTQYPGDRGRARGGHRVALDAGAHAARVAFDPHEAAHRADHESRARHELDVVVAEPRPRSSPALGFGRDPQPSHVELVRQMMTECPPETRLESPRALIGLDLTARAPEGRHPDAGDRRYGRHPHAARAGAR